MAPVVRVTNVEELYAAVNNPASEETIIELARGEYKLTPLDPQGKPRPNRGSLILPARSALRGQNQYKDADGDGVWDSLDPKAPDIYAIPASETILNAELLVGLTGDDNVISLGLDNQVERLTVKNNTQAGALIGVTIKGPDGGLRGKVKDCIVEGGQRGIRAQHPNEGFSGLESHAVFEGNISRRHFGGFNFGIQVQNVKVTDARWKVVLRRNRCYGSRFGLFVVNLSCTQARLFIESQGNIYERNAVGCILHAGRDAAGQGFLTGSNDNELHFDSKGDAIWNNSGDPGPLRTGGGVDARAAWRTKEAAETSSNNRLRLQFLGTRFVQGSGSENLAFQDGRRDLTLFGAIGLEGVKKFFPGSGNGAELLIRNSQSDGAPKSFLVVDSDPPAPNQVTVIGSDQAIESANLDVAIPA